MSVASAKKAATPAVSKTPAPKVRMWLCVCVYACVQEYGV